MRNIPNCLVNISTGVNSLTCGKPGFSLCARFHEGRLHGRPVHTIMANFADLVFYWDKQHCRKAYQLVMRRNYGINLA